MSTARKLIVCLFILSTLAGCAQFAERYRDELAKMQKPITCISFDAGGGMFVTQCH